MSMKKLMETDRQELISKGQLVKSHIDGVSDFIWSFGRRLSVGYDQRNNLVFRIQKSGSGSMVSEI